MSIRPCRSKKDWALQDHDCAIFFFKRPPFKVPYSRFTSLKGTHDSQSYHIPSSNRRDWNPEYLKFLKVTRGYALKTR